MAETVQVNIRVQPEAKDIIARLGRKLRDDPAFLDRLTALVDGPTGPDLTDRLAEIEARLAALERQK
jgi:hypothetical protein